MQYTNRAHWRRTIADWAAEIEQLGPRLHQETHGDTPPRRATPDFPALCQPPNRSIDHLDAEELVAIGQQLDRSAALRESKAPRLAALLEKLLGNSRGFGGQPSETDEMAADGAEGMPASALRRFLEALENAVGKD